MKPFLSRIHLIFIYLFLLSIAHLCYADNVIIMYDIHGQQQWVKRLDDIYFDAKNNQYRESGNHLAKYDFSSDLREWLVDMPQNTYFYKVINNEIFVLLKDHPEGGRKFITYDTTGHFIWDVDFQLSSPGLLELADSMLFLDFSTDLSTINTYQYSFSGELLSSGHNPLPYDRLSNAWVSLLENDVEKNIYYLIRAENADSELNKIDSSGQPEWSCNLEQEFKSQYDLIDHGAVSPSGNTYILIDERKPAGLGMIDCRLLFIDPDGQRQNNIPLQWPAESSCWDEIKVDSEDNILLTAANDDEDEYKMLKIDKSGELLWAVSQPLFVRTSGGHEFYEYHHVLIDSEDNVYLAGDKTWDIDKNYAYDMHLVKFNSDGGLDWARNYNGPDGKSDQCTGINSDNAGNVYLIGKTEKNGDEENEEKGCGL